jgi:maleate cis-trans isomerase
MLIADGTSTEEIIEMDREDGMRAIPPDRQLPAACDCLRLHRVEHYPRPSFDERLRAEIRRIAGLPATTATDSIFVACRTLGLNRVRAISPEAVDAAQAHVLRRGRH